jgi:type II secretory pathway component GspD/PulD (secretin)
MLHGVTTRENQGLGFSLLLAMGLLFGTGLEFARAQDPAGAAPTPPPSAIIPNPQRPMPPSSPSAVITPAPAPGQFSAPANAVNPATGAPVAPARKVVGAPSIPVDPEAVGGAVPRKPGSDALPEVLYESPGEDRGTSGTTLKGAGEDLAKAKPESPKVTVIVKQMDVEQVFERLRQQTGVRVRADGATRGQKLDLTARGIPLEDVLTQIATPRTWVWVKENDTSYAMYDQQTYINTVQAKQVLRVPFQLKYIDAEELDKIIQPILTPQIGASSPDSRTNKLIVTDLPDKIALITSIIAEYDVQLYTRVFEVKNAKTEEISDRLGEIKSKSAEIQVDPVNRTIIVKDTFEKIKQMEQLVEILDRDQEIRIYNINNIGIDSEIAQDLIDTFIKPIATDDAVVEFNDATGKLFVKDVRSVHEKIIDILRQIDRPRKQVLIEGEILSVLLTKSDEKGANWAFGNDLRKDTANGLLEAAGVPTAGSGLPVQTAGSAGMGFSYFSRNLSMQISALMSDQRTRLLLRPRLLIANHEQGSFNVTTNEPILNTYYNGYNNNSTTGSGYTSSGQSTVETGIIVEITPHISNRGLVELETHFENSSPRIVDDIGNGTRGVGTNVESAETFLIIPSGDTRVIGGLIRDNDDKTKKGVPYLSQLPYLGWLFGSDTKSKDQRNLMFFITPTIIEEEPQNDIVDEPVNAMARLTMAQEAKVAEEETTDTAGVNPIPDSLRAYLEQIRPEAIPMGEQSDEGTMPQETTATTTTEPAPLQSEGTTLPTEPAGTQPEAEPQPMTEEQGLPGKRVILQETTTTATTTTRTISKEGAVDASGLLRNEPYTEVQLGAPALKVGGAVASLATGGTGPKGALSSSAASAKSKPGTGAKNAQGTRPGGTGTAPVDGRQAAPKATPTPIPTSKSKTKPSYMTHKSGNSSTLPLTSSSSAR